MAICDWLSSAVNRAQLSRPIIIEIPYAAIHCTFIIILQLGAAVSFLLLRKTKSCYLFSIAFL